jgi:uncharacterized protein (DUF362 family)
VHRGGEAFVIRWNRQTTRRDALKMGLALGSSSLLGWRDALGKGDGRPKAVVSEGKSSRVAVAREEGLTVKKASAESLLPVLDRGVEALFGGPARDVWGELIRPDDVVGIKVNCLAGRGMSTRLDLVQALIRRVEDAGVPRRRIIIWDRLSADLKRAAYPLNRGGTDVQSYGNDVGGYDRKLTIHRSVGSILARLLTKECSVVINVPVLKDHGICGVTLALKNYFGAIHNPNKYHVRTGDPFIADLNALPVIRKKTVLTVADAIQAQYEGGPPYMPHWTWDYGGLLLATDPVAMDALGWSILEDERKTHGMPSLREANREPTYIATAAGLGLGSDDIEQIEVETV